MSESHEIAQSALARSGRSPADRRALLVEQLATIDVQLEYSQLTASRRAALLVVRAVRVSELDELDAEDEQDLSPVACETHGDVEIVDEHCVSGFTGAPIYFVDLSCGCQLVDASADNLGAAE